jgi:hypothetical protein
MWTRLRISTTLLKTPYTNLQCFNRIILRHLDCVRSFVSRRVAHSIHEVSRRGHVDVADIGAKDAYTEHARVISLGSDFLQEQKGAFSKPKKVDVLCSFCGVTPSGKVIGPVYCKVMTCIPSSILLIFVSSESRVPSEQGHQWPGQLRHASFNCINQAHLEKFPMEDHRRNRFYGILNHSATWDAITNPKHIYIVQDKMIL